MTITADTTIIITTEVISAKTIKGIGSQFGKVGTFVQDGDCGWVKINGEWQFVCSIEAAKLIVGYTL